jgi:hypothetical protein
MPLDAERTRFFCCGAYPHFFFAGKKVLQLLAPERKGAGMGKVGVKRRFFEAPKPYVMACARAFVRIGGDFKADVVRTVKEVQCTKGRGRVGKVKSEGDCFAQPVSEGHRFGGMPASGVHGALEMVATLHDKRDVNWVGGPAIPRRDVEGNVVGLDKNAENTDKKGNDAVRKRAVQQKHGKKSGNCAVDVAVRSRRPNAKIPIRHKKRSSTCIIPLFYTTQGVV